MMEKTAKKTSDNIVEKQTNQAISFSGDQLALFRQIIEKDLTDYAKVLSNTHNLPLEDIVAVIPKIMEKPVHTKILSSFHDTTGMVYRSELNKYTLADLREICKHHNLKISGKRSELVDRIAASINLKEHSQEDIAQNKSFISKPFKQHKRKSATKKKPSNIISDSDSD